MKKFECDRFLREAQILGEIIPISRSSWWAGIRRGVYPQPVKLGTRTTAWKASDIVALVERLGQGGGA